MFGFGRRKAAESRRGGSFLSRLARDSRGNTLAIVGAALIPLTAMIGSGVDMSRAYMAKTRLQMACDASALAARRIMQNDTLTQTVTDEGVRYFNFNFNQGMYGTASFTPSITKPTSGKIRVTASTTIPTTIMRMFGFTTLPLSVSCDAELNFVNTDVMLVLDTTGSMDEDVNGNSTNNDANRKITALRAAVLALYDELKPTQDMLEAQTPSLRLRYGIVPYSSSVNVGTAIRAMSNDYLRNSTPYQTWTSNYGSWGTRTNSDTTVTETYSSSITSAQCDQYGVNAGYPTLNGQPANTGGPNPAPVTQVIYSRRDFGATGDTSGTTQTCRRNKRTLVTQTGYIPTSQTWRQASVDTSQFKLGNSVNVATDDVGAMASSDGQADPREVGANAYSQNVTPTTWNGCIEERDSTSSITGTPPADLAIPAAATDLDINLIPTTEATRWRPMWPEITWRRTAGSTTASSGTQMSTQDSSNWACPTAAARMQAWTRADLSTYVNSLNPLGGTYHDIGMIWGARMLSPNGAFAPDNPVTFHNMSVTRYIIFMTDGNLAPNCNTYTSYGIEQNDMRVTGSSSCSDQLNRHMVRFKMACNAARGMGFSIWVIAFGTTLTSDMQSCASNASQASTAADSPTLIARFRQIGQNIGALRLTQ